MPKTNKVHHNSVVAGQQEHDAKVFLIYTVLALVVLAILIPGLIFRLRVYQVAELLALAVVVWWFFKGIEKKAAERRELAKSHGPKRRLLVTDREERRALEQAQKDGTTFLGWSNDRKPLYWTDDQRYMQTSMPGANGAGKSTMLYNILEQDIQRGRSVIFIDGKGSQDMMADLIEAATKAGRAGDLRILDPDHPSYSAKYNPFFDPGGSIEQRAGLVFDSLPAAASSDPYFAQLQRSTFMALTWLLSQKLNVQTLSAVYRSGQNPDVVRWLVEEVSKSADVDALLPRYMREAIEFACMKLQRRYDSNDWSKLLDGLFNSLDTFVGTETSEIINSTSDLVSIREVMDKQQILLTTLNTNRTSDLTAIGRMLTRDIQAQVGNRYARQGGGDSGMVSVVLDEFGLFASKAFSGLVNTARGAHVALIFSFQDVPQLKGLLGDAFASDIATGTNNKLVMRVTESETAREFAAAAGTEWVKDFTKNIYRDGDNPATDYHEEGRGSVRMVQRPRVEESDLRRLPTGQCWAILPEARLGLEPTLIHARYPKRYGLRGSYMPGIPMSYLATRNARIEPVFTASDQGPKNKRRGRQ